MSVSIGLDTDSIAGWMEQKSGILVQRCYQCGKCSAGCPAANEMDFTPSVLLHLLQTQRNAADKKVLSSYTIWLCLSCQTCVTRCPMEVDLPKVMDLLRAEALKRRTVHPRAKEIIAFHTSFLNTIKRFGRLWEVGLVGEYKLRTRHWLQDVLLSPSMFLKGKLSLLPHRIKGKDEVKSIFNQARSEKENAP
jgi:heterodisulfide reductase subunit C2